MGEPATEIDAMDSAKDSRGLDLGLKKAMASDLDGLRWRPLFRSQLWTLWVQDSIEATWCASVDKLVPIYSWVSAAYWWKDTMLLVFCLQLPNLLSYPFSILQPLLKSLHSYQVLLTLLVILIQSLPLSNNANLFFFPQSQISSTYLCPLESFLINSKTVLYIHFSKNPTLTKKTYPTTGQYLTYLTYPNSQNDLLKTDLLTISMETTSWTLSSLPTPNSTLLKPLYLLYTTTLSEPWVNSKSLVSLSAAFDTIDHTILLHRLKSWFGFTDTVLSWIQSYLSSRSFTVDINGIKSPPSKLLYDVPQGSVLGPLLFILYTTPLSSIISQSSVNHKLYADDTQLFLSFSADTFSENILLLQNTIPNISSWMASNFLSLNPAETEFLPIGLPAQLSKIHNPTLTISSNTTIQPVSSARNLCIIFDSNLSFSEHTFRNPSLICDVFVIL